VLQVNIHDAKSQLSKLIERVRRGEEVIIAKAGKPVARLSAYEQREHGRRFGALRGKARADRPFFDALPEEDLEAWE
jgi:prevent-host-death family protein